MSSWPAEKFSSVPTLETATELAKLVRGAAMDSDNAERGRCDLQAICRIGRFLPKRDDKRFVDSSHDALLIPRPDGTFVILVDPVPKSQIRIAADVSRHRNRFRVAHEIGHSFFYDRTKIPPRRLVKATAEEETFCDAFASALLVPVPAVQAMSPTPDSIFEIQALYDVSAQVAARAVAQAHSSVSVIGLLWRPHPKSGKKGMRVVWHAGSQFVPLDARLRSQIVDRALYSGNAVGTDNLVLGQLKGKYQIAAARNKGRRQLIVVIQPVIDNVDESSSAYHCEQLPLGDIDMREHT